MPKVRKSLWNRLKKITRGGEYKQALSRQRRKRKRVASTLIGGLQKTMNKDTVRIAAKILILEDAIVARQVLEDSISNDELGVLHTFTKEYKIAFTRGIEIFHKAAEMLFFDVSELHLNSNDIFTTIKCDYFTYRRIEGQVVTCIQLCLQK